MSFEHDADQIADDPVMMAAVEMIGRTGAEGFQIRFCDEEEPVVWMAVAVYSLRENIPVPKGTGDRIGHEVAAGMTPKSAVMRLLDQIVDGAKCTHCERPTGVTEDFGDEMPLPEFVCWYRYDPELKTFRRGCE